MSKSEQRQDRTPDVPPALQSDDISARILREHLWKPANHRDDWRVFAIVGRENTGKSLTCASILAAVDPQFSIDNVHFEPVPFLDDVRTEMDEPGRGMMSDETGVAFGNRTWHDREQIEANQYLQTARRHNRIIGMTAPRMEEIDKQLKGRMHMFFHTKNVVEGDHVVLQVKFLDPTRNNENVLRTPFPRKEIDDRVRRVRTIRVGLPPEGLIAPYEEKKAEWQHDLGDRVIDRYEEDEQQAQHMSAKDIASQIVEEESVDDYLKSNHEQRYVDRSKLAAKHDLGPHKSKAVKSLLLEEVDDNDVM